MSHPACLCMRLRHRPVIKSDQDIPALQRHQCRFHVTYDRRNLAAGLLRNKAANTICLFLLQCNLSHHDILRDLSTFWECGKS